MNDEYKKEYDKFVTSYETGVTSGEETGFMVVRLAQYFCDANMDLAKRDKMYLRKYAEIVNSIDEISAKPMSVAKADAMSRATEEYAMFLSSKIRLQNIEQCINSLKSLQKGILNEYSHVGGSM